MDTQTIIVNFNSNTNSGRTIELGRCGESGSREIRFDLSSAYTEFGNGEVIIKHKRHINEYPYIVTATVENGGFMSWVISETDTAYPGSGELELNLMYDGNLVKSVTYRTNVRKALTPITRTVQAAIQPFEIRLGEQISAAKEYSETLNSQLKDIKFAIKNSEVELWATDNVIYWRHNADPQWETLLDVNNMVGPKGDTPNLTFGTIEIGDVDSEPSATITGTKENPVLNLVIPKVKGEKGDPFTYSDFTAEQLAGLKGDKGDAFTYSDFTPEQLAGLKGEKGDAFTFDDFTPEQLASLKGEKGDPGDGGNQFKFGIGVYKNDLSNYFLMPDMFFESEEFNVIYKQSPLSAAIGSIAMISIVNDYGYLDGLEVASFSRLGENADRTTSFYYIGENYLISITPTVGDGGFTAPYSTTVEKIFEFVEEEKGSGENG